MRKPSSRNNPSASKRGGEMSDKTICDSCGELHLREFVCNTKIMQAWADKCDRLKYQLAEARKEIEVLIWNLAGCSTFALGYGIHEPFDQTMARPAMHDVLNLAKKMEIAREALESISKNSCCEPCREAGLWAKSALSKIQAGSGPSGIGGGKE